jgi:heme-degrading monooxygenase HmoA
MMTVITEITIEPGQEPKWDETFRTRYQDVKGQPGWLGMQLLIPLDAPNKRLVVGTWQTRADWEAWHNTKSFQKTRETMDSVKQSSSEDRWYEVVLGISPEA